MISSSDEARIELSNVSFSVPNGKEMLVEGKLYFNFVFVLLEGHLKK